MSSSKFAELESEFKNFFEQIQEPMLNVFYEIYRMEPEYIRGQERKVAPGLSRDASRDEFVSHVTLATVKGVVKYPGLDLEKLHTHLRKRAKKYGAANITYLHLYETMRLSFHACVQHKKKGQVMHKRIDEALEAYHIASNSSLTLDKAVEALDKKLKDLDKRVSELRETLYIQLDATDHHSPERTNAIRASINQIMSRNDELDFWRTIGLVEPSRLDILNSVNVIIGEMTQLCYTLLDGHRC